MRKSGGKNLQYVVFLTTHAKSILSSPFYKRVTFLSGFRPFENSTENISFESVKLRRVTFQCYTFLSIITYFKGLRHPHFVQCMCKKAMFIMMGILNEC